MKAVVVEQPGAPEVLQVKEIPTPEAKAGWVLVKIKAFGLNRSELFTRQGHSPSVKFPRVLGIECVGEVVAAPEGGLQPGQKVAAIMGGLGRDYDGGYAEYSLIPARQVMPLDTDLPWEVLGAIPETFMTAWGSLFDAMDIQAGQTLLIRGGTSALGMAAANIAKEHGLTVVATTRSEAKRAALVYNGADEVIIDNGKIAEAVRQLYPDGVEAVLELIGANTLIDSLYTLKPKGIVCNSGILGNNWILKEFEPLGIMPSTTRLTVYNSGTVNAANGTAALQHIVESVQAGRYRVNIDKIFRIDDIVAAHEYMENNSASGKVVVLTD